MVEVLARPWLDIRGLSITVPHKENALRFLREAGGSIDPLALRIGAVNTIQLDHAGGIRGFNTDYTGIMETIKSTVLSSDDQARPCGAVLGAGGIARAAIVALQDFGCGVTIYNRTQEKAVSLAGIFNTELGLWQSGFHTGRGFIVNCTTLGMAPNVEATAIPADAIPPDSIVIDAVYNPLQTRLLRDARNRGCQTRDGLDIFLAQAAAQFAIWHGRPFDYRLLRSHAEKVLTGLR
jgi:shikimate dehydrogenase